MTVRSIPSFRLNTYGREAFPVAGPTVWNSPGFYADPAISTDCFNNSAVAEIGDRLATIDVDRKVGRGAAVPLSVGGELGSHLTQCRLGRGLPPCHVASWSLQPLGHNTPKLQTDRRDNGPVAYGGPLLLTVAQKRICSLECIQLISGCRP